MIDVYDPDNLIANYVVANVNKIKEIIDVCWQELKINRETVLSQVRCLGATSISMKKHDGSNSHL